LTIQYDGSDFHGWQVQARGRTVQGDIENALSVIYPDEKITLIGAGRTDAGVHALGQTAHINLPTKLSADELLQAINGNLNQDVRIDFVEKADDDFHARFSATAREYAYHIVKHFRPVTRNYTTPLKFKVDVKILNKCAYILPGEHDLTSFCKATAEVDHKLCNVHSATWEESEEMLIFRVKANRFLQHMVRYLVGTMLEVARGRYTSSDFESLLNNKQTKAVVVRAPAQGLFLKKVYYN
jgi:tRNA pseudouridine38-40 synthase